MEQLAYQSYEGLMNSDIPANLSSGAVNSSGSSDFSNLFIFLFYAIYIGIFILAFYIVNGICFMKIAKRVGYKHPWFAWVPVCSTILKLNIAGFSGWYILLMLLLLLIPIIGWIGLAGFTIYIWMQISKACKKPDFLGLLILVPLANLILPLYFAYSNEEY